MYGFGIWFQGSDHRHVPGHTSQLVKRAPAFSYVGRLPRRNPAILLVGSGDLVTTVKGK